MLRIFTYGLQIRKSEIRKSGIRKNWFTLSIAIFIGIVLAFPLRAQKTTYLEAGYSLGVFRSKAMDEWDNGIIYGHSVFQPLYLYVNLIENKWTQRLIFYYIKNKMNPITGSELFSYNEVASESGELRYEVMYEIYHPEESGFSVYAGSGIHAFGSFRDRKTKSRKYPYESNVSSYDVNAASLQAMVGSAFKKNRTAFMLTLSTGLINYLTRPDSYNPRFNSNNGKWELVSVDKHFNMVNTFSWKQQISNKLFLNVGYRFFYYKYSFPYRLKVLNQNYLIGLSYKF